MSLETTTTSAANLPEPNPAELAVLEEMSKAGILYGRKKMKTNPKMRPFILATRSGVEIFDLPQVVETVAKAQEFVRQIRDKKGKILFVSTQSATKDLVKALAEKMESPFVTERWLGGTFTNYAVLSQRIRHYTKLKNDRVTGRLEKYTKKERIQFDKEIARMDKFFSGIEKMDRLPDALFVVDTALKNHLTAVLEANKLNIPVVAIVNSDNNPSIIKYAVPGNTSARLSVEWLLAKIFA